MRKIDALNELRRREETHRLRSAYLLHCGHDATFVRIPCDKVRDIHGNPMNITLWCENCLVGKALGIPVGERTR